MKEVVVNKLSVGGKVMGYRLNIINSGFKVASLDMTVSNFKKLTEVFKPINPVMGSIIPAKPK